MNTAAPQLQSEDVFEFEALVEKVSHLLPAQAPIRRFVHHNTLHHFQELEFHDAVQKGAEIFDCQPYPLEAFFARERQSGRIKERDLESVLEEDEERPFPFADWTRREFKLFRLRYLFERPQEARIRYLLEEGDLLQQLSPLVATAVRDLHQSREDLPETLVSLWRSLQSKVPPTSVKPRPRSSSPVGELHGFLIRFCSAYLDQGISYWPMPLKSGLYHAFLSLYSMQTGLALPWQNGLAARLNAQFQANWTATDALADAFARLGISCEESYAALKERALALRGWAGMIAVLEKRPDLAPIESPPVTLQDYLAIYFQLEAHISEQTGNSTSATGNQRRTDYELTYEAFLLAQCSGLGLDLFCTPKAAKAWVTEVRNFDGLSRRRLLLEAYERRYRQDVVDGLIHHCRVGEARAADAPRFQAVFCIDDREESVRRHMEELCPDLETLGYAGFYGVTMRYQGLTDPHSTPLCPPVRTPKHLVREVLLEGPAPSAALGAARQTWRASRNTLVGGSFLSAAAGILAGIPLIGQTLFPGLSHRIGSALEEHIARPPRTRLALERPEGQPPNEEGYYEGFTVAEMVEIVKGGLQTMGVHRFAPLFAVVGHGSSSLNNPHEAAHDCGATGGGRGGPNARAFCAMANHPEVRRELGQAGIDIPEQTWFVPAYHNTCDDSMTYYDLDLVPQHLKAELEELKSLFHRGCVLDAHERCRRFENLPLSATPKAAYDHVQTRAVTLAQPRPEYGHCTNSLCIVGRRERTRGMFFDRRAFLVSYDSTRDKDGSVLGGLLEAVGPVGAGINLEYYFSSIDPSGYGCGTKLPHNVTGLLGVMDGHASDLRTGLPWQMVEIHEPMRLLNIVESPPEVLMQVLVERPGLKDLVDKGWIIVVAWSPEDDRFWLYDKGAFQPHQLEAEFLPQAPTSLDYYQGKREHLPVARMSAGVERTGRN